MKAYVKYIVLLAVAAAGFFTGKFDVDTAIKCALDVEQSKVCYEKLIEEVPE